MRPTPDDVRLEEDIRKALNPTMLERSRVLRGARAGEGHGRISRHTWVALAIAAALAIVAIWPRTAKTQDLVVRRVDGLFVVQRQDGTLVFLSATGRRPRLGLPSHDPNLERSPQ